jgi:hypothetical protein
MLPSAPVDDCSSLATGNRATDRVVRLETESELPWSPMKAKLKEGHRTRCFSYSRRGTRVKIVEGLTKLRTHP